MRCGFDPWIRRIPWSRKCNPNQYSCLENPMDQGTWWTTVHGVAKNWTQLSKWAQMDGWLANPGHPWNQKSALMLVWVISESRSVVSNSLWLHGLNSPWNSPGQNTGVGSLSFLQGIFPTQGSNPSLLNCWQFLYQLSHKGSLMLAHLGNLIVILSHLTDIYTHTPEVSPGPPSSASLRMNSVLLWCLLTAHLTSARHVCTHTWKGLMQTQQ